MQTHKLYLKTTSKTDLLLDLIDAGLATIGTENLSVSLKSGVAVHYVGAATAKLGTFPPVEETPAEYYDDERANVLLSGEEAGVLSNAFDVATFSHGTEIMPEPAEPKSVWA